MSEKIELNAAEYKKALEEHIANMISEWISGYRQKTGFVVEGVEVDMIETHTVGGEKDYAVGRVKFSIDS